MKFEKTLSDSPGAAPWSKSDVCVWLVFVSKFNTVVGVTN